MNAPRTDWRFSIPARFYFTVEAPTEREARNRARKIAGECLPIDSPLYEDYIVNVDMGDYQIEEDINGAVFLLTGLKGTPRPVLESQL